MKSKLVYFVNNKLATRKILIRINSVYFVPLTIKDVRDVF